MIKIIIIIIIVAGHDLIWWNMHYFMPWSCSTLNADGCLVNCTKAAGTQSSDSSRDWYLNNNVYESPGVGVTASGFPRLSIFYPLQPFLGSVRGSAFGVGQSTDWSGDGHRCPGVATPWLAPFCTTFVSVRGGPVERFLPRSDVTFLKSHRYCNRPLADGIKVIYNQRLPLE